MPTEATVTLEELSCRTLKDFETSVEPYIWPVLIKIDSSTINAADGRRVDVIAPSDANSLVRIKSGMKAGTSAPIPGSLGTLSARFTNSTSNQQLIVLVQLMERDETPGHAMHKGYRAYVKELRAAFKAEFIHLFEAENDDAELALVVGRIKKRVEGKVTSVIEDSLSVGEKIKANFQDQDDAIGSAFARFKGDPIKSAPILLKYDHAEAVAIGNNPFNKIDTFVSYRIRGRLRMREV